MTIAQLLQKRLPARFQRKSDGSLDVYALAKHLNIKPQTIYEWFRKGRVALPAVEALMRVEDSNFELSDFRPFCSDLVIVLDIQKEREGPKEDVNEN